MLACMSQWLTLSRAAHLLGISRVALQKRIREGDLPSFDGMVTVGTGRSTSVEALADVLMAALLDGVRGRLPENS